MKILLFLGLMVFAMGQTILFALAGPAARVIGMAEWQVGAIVSAAAVVYVIASPIWGGLSDQWGRRTVFVTGLVGYGATTLLFVGLLWAGMNGLIGPSIAFAALLAARLLYALVTSGVQPSAIALMADETTSENRSSGVALVGAGFGLGSVLGPALAAGLVTFGLLTPLFVVAGLAVIIALLAALPTMRTSAAPASTTPAAKVQLGPIAPLLALAFGLYTAVAALQQTTAFYIQDFTGARPEEAARLAGYAFMALAAAILVMQGLIVQLLKPPPALMLGAGVPIAAVGIVAYVLAPSMTHVVSAFAIMGAGFGLAQPGVSAAVSLRTSAETQGGAAGYVQAAMSGGFIVGPLGGTLLYRIDHHAPMGLALLSLLFCLVLVLVLRPWRTEPLFES